MMTSSTFCVHNVLVIFECIVGFGFPCRSVSLGSAKHRTPWYAGVKVLRTIKGA